MCLIGDSESMDEYGRMDVPLVIVVVPSLSTDNFVVVIKGRQREPHQAVNQQFWPAKTAIVKCGGNEARKQF